MLTPTQSSVGFWQGKPGLVKVWDGAGFVDGEDFADTCGTTQITVNVSIFRDAVGAAKAE